MDLFVYKLLKKSSLHISAGKKITASPSTCLGCLEWSLHSCSTTLGQGRDRRSSAPTPPSGQHKNTSQLPAVMLSTKHSTQPNHRSWYAAVSVGMKTLCFTATNETVPILVIGITVILQNHYLRRNYF